MRSGAAPEDSECLAAICPAVVEGAIIVGRASHDDRIFGVLQRQQVRLVDR